MIDGESEVSLDLNRSIKADSERSVAAIELYPPEPRHDCPECGKRLHVQSIVHTNDELIAVEYSCLRAYQTQWGWEQATDEIHYRGKMNVSSFWSR